MFPENAWSFAMKKEKEESASKLLSVDLIPTFYISYLKLVCLVLHRDAILTLVEHSITDYHRLWALFKLP